MFAKTLFITDTFSDFGPDPKLSAVSKTLPLIAIGFDQGLKALTMLSFQKQNKSLFFSEIKYKAAKTLKHLALLEPPPANGLHCP